MRLNFHLNGRITALTVCVLPLLITLGFWQLNRADEKRQIQQAFEQKQQQAPRPLTQLSAEQKSIAAVDMAFTPVTVTGEFDQQHVLLLDNQVVNGQVGYDVLVPLKIAVSASSETQWVLINRGWVAAPPTRDQLPAIPLLSDGVMQLQGSVYVSPGEAFLLEDQNWQQAEWPLVIQSVDVPLLAKTLSRTFFPYQVRLADTDRAALNVHWQTISVEPQKHVAYAVQWFAMATALIIWFVFAQSNAWQLLTRRTQQT